MIKLTESLDLLVHPGYTISKKPSNDGIDKESEQNILRLKELWLNSISDAASDPTRYFAIVNAVNLPDEFLVVHESSNPFRGLYKEVIAHAKQCLEGRLFYFSPAIYPEDISVAEAQGGLLVATHSGTEMEYDAAKFKIYAYGEHVDTNKQFRAGPVGCVDISVRDLRIALRLPQDNVITDHNKSLPSEPVQRVVQQYGPYELQVYGTPALYVTVAQLEQSHQW